MSDKGKCPICGEPYERGRHMRLRDEQLCVGPEPSGEREDECVCDHDFLGLEYHQDCPIHGWAQPTTPSPSEKPDGAIHESTIIGSKPPAQLLGRHDVGEKTQIEPVPWRCRIFGHKFWQFFEHDDHATWEFVGRCERCGVLVPDHPESKSSGEA